MRNFNQYIKLENNSNSNFRYREFIKSQTAIRKGINNTPKDRHIQNMEYLVRNGLQPVRDRFGPILITSGYRSPELCMEIGSYIYSNHTNGGTADFEPLNDNYQLITILNFIHDNLPYRELIAEYFPDGWIHFSQLKGANKGDLKLKDDNHDYDRVTIDYINSIYG